MSKLIEAFKALNYKCNCISPDVGMMGKTLTVAQMLEALSEALGKCLSTSANSSKQ